MYKIEILKRKNSRKYSYLKDIGETIAEVLKYLKDNNIQADTVNTPYIFTHIKLSDNSIIVQTVNNFSCSPTKLLEALKS